MGADGVVLVDDDHGDDDGAVVDVCWAAVERAGVECGGDV